MTPARASEFGCMLKGNVGGRIGSERRIPGLAVARFTRFSNQNYRVVNAEAEVLCDWKASVSWGELRGITCTVTQVLPGGLFTSCAPFTGDL